MNARSDFIAALFSEAPGFEARWREVLARWEPESPGHYNAMLEFAGYLVECQEIGDTRCFGPVFGVIERFAQSTDTELLNLISVGLFEDIQNISSHRPFGQDVFLGWLGPRSRQLWDNMIEAWAEFAELERQGRGAQTVRWWQFWRRPRTLGGDGGALDDMLNAVSNPDLRRIIEAMHRRQRGRPG